MDKSQLTAALLAAQRQMTGAYKDASNPHFKSRYADLESILDAVKLPLNDAGIIITQPIARIGDDWCVCTTLTHSGTGETLESQMPIVCKDMADPQKWGSAITYARRYSLQSLVALPAIDDDGNTASEPSPPRKPAPAPAPRPCSMPIANDAPAPSPPPPSAHEDAPKAAALKTAWAIAKQWGADPTDWSALFRNQGYDTSAAAPMDYVLRLKTKLENKADLLSQVPYNAHETLHEWLAARGGILNAHIDDIRAAVTDAVNRIGAAS